MKTLITTFIFFASFIGAYAQDFPRNPDTGLYEYSEVVESNFNKNQLYSNARGWFVRVFNSSNNVIQYQDKEEGKIEGHFEIPVIAKPLGMTYDAGKVQVQVTVLVKDNKYKYIFTNFYHVIDSPKISWRDMGQLEKYEPDGFQVRGPNKKQFSYIKEQVNNSITSIILELKNKMLQNSNDF